MLEGGDKVAAQEDYVACERRGINCLGYCLENIGGKEMSEPLR